MKCWFCGRIVKVAWKIKLKDKTTLGRYCTKRCAQGDSWGPICIGSVPVKSKNR